ncbi:hypothetical protein [Acrocarpospora sp. B8E8]|uniref:hypothetical protein n=1 Tax=Acrocarpospora sp. B8E8 TaxID=3153572 RepID=UPI00325C956F
MKVRATPGALGAALVALSMLSLIGSSAQAATVITATLGIDFNPPPGPALINADSVTHIETNLYDGVGYLNNGARIELRYYGDDPGSGDALLVGPLVYYNGTPGLYVDDNGIWLEHLLQVPASVFNEDDSWFNRTDEIYLRATFIDGDGGTIRDDSNVVSIFL